MLRERRPVLHPLSSLSHRVTCAPFASRVSSTPPSAPRSRIARELLHSFHRSSSFAAVLGGWASRTTQHLALSIMGGRRDFRWGDAAEEDDGIEGVLPPTQVIGPDEKGVKIIIEWRKNEEGVRTKVTKTVRVKKQVGRDGVVLCGVGECKETSIVGSVVGDGSVCVFVVYP